MVLMRLQVEPCDDFSIVRYMVILTLTIKLKIDEELKTQVARLIVLLLLLQSLFVVANGNIIIGTFVEFSYIEERGRLLHQHIYPDQISYLKHNYYSQLTYWMIPQYHYQMVREDINLPW